MPFLHALGEMPRFSCHLKELLKHKKGMSDLSKVWLNEECLAILYKGYPPKRDDPGAFVVPCMVKDLDFDNALDDLGASINVMPSFVVATFEAYFFVYPSCRWVHSVP